MSLMKTPDRLPASRRRLHEARERDRRHSPPRGIPKVGIIHDEFPKSLHGQVPKAATSLLLGETFIFTYFHWGDASTTS